MRAPFVFLMSALLLPTAVSAQTADAPSRPVAGRPLPPANDGWSVTIGLAPVLSPAWQGSKDMALSIFPDLRINYGDVLFASVPDGIGWNAVRQDGWRAGPVVKLRFGRDENDGGSPFLITGGSDALRGLGDVSATAEFGGFVEKQFGGRRQWRARAEARQGLGGGHEGLLADVGLAYQGRGSGLIYSVGPRATVASGNFMRTYFGIDPGQSLRSGLASYRPAGGLLSAGIGGTLVRPLNRNSAITLFTGMDYLGNEAGRSPLIRERGRRTQATIGIGYGYRFGL